MIRRVRSLKPRFKPALGVGFLALGSCLLALPLAVAHGLDASYVQGPVVAADAYARYSSAGLGSADVGGTYQASAPSKDTFQVYDDAAQVGPLTRGTGTSFSLPTVSVRDQLVRQKIQLPIVPTDRAGLYDAIEVRTQSDGSHYALNAIVNTNGQVNLALSRFNQKNTTRLGEIKSPLTMKSGQKVFVDFQVVGQDKPILEARIFADGQPAGDWQIKVADNSGSALSTAGWVQFSQYQSLYGTPTRLAIRDLRVWSMVRPTNTTTTTGRPVATTAAPTTTSTSAAPTTTTSPPTTAPVSTHLDPTGMRLPDTNYPIPSNAVFMATTGSDANDGSLNKPVKTLNRAINMVSVNGTIVVRGGTYRDQYNNGGDSYKIITKAFTLQAYPHEQPWFDGTDAVASADWQSDGNGHWYKDWATPSFCDGHYYDYAYGAQPHANQGPCSHWDVNGDGDNDAAVDPQMVFLDGKSLHEVSSLDRLSAGRFYYAQDLTHKSGRIYVADQPVGHTIEVSKRPNALVLGGSGYSIKGIGFRRYATNEYSNLTSGAVYIGASNSTIENSVFTENAAIGLSMGSVNGIVRSTVFANNGDNAMGSNGSVKKGKVDNLLIDANIINNNGGEGFGTHCSASCGQGGIKIAHMNGFVMRNNVVTNNIHGPGLWCDEECEHGTFVDNYLSNNESGIDYEVSNNGIIASNVVVNSRHYGILSGSANMKIYNNTLVNNASTSMWIYDDDRNSSDLRGTDVSPDTVNVDIKNNVMFGGNITTLKINRGSGGLPNTGPNQFITGLDYNSYYRADGAGKSMINWIDTSNSANYTSLDQFRKAHPFESHGQDVAGAADPFFLDSAAGKYQVRPGSGASKSGTALPADVAQAIGVSAAAGQNRGALVFSSLG